jgi:hypothetical protein
MIRKSVFTKSLAIIGTVLVLFPILATILISLLGWMARGFLRVDYLLPAELSLVALIGGIFLVAAAWWARSQRGLVTWSFAVAFGMLVASQALAVVTGLASGEIEPGGWAWYLVLAGLALYTLGVVALGIGGIRLVRDLFRKPRDQV